MCVSVAHAIPSPLAIAAVLATACLFAGAASLGGRWSEEGAFWPPVVLLVLGGLSAFAGLRALRTDGPASLPETSGALYDLLARRPAALTHSSQQQAATGALCHALYGEHELARSHLEQVLWPDLPALQVLRGQTLAALAYLRGDGLVDALDQARRAQRLSRRLREGVQASTLAEFHVAWGEALMGELPEAELELLDAASLHENLAIAFMARAARARALSAFGHEALARAARDELHALAPEALGLLAHADGGSGVSGVRSSVEEMLHAASRD